MTGPLFPENYSKIWIRGRFITMAGVAVRGKLTLAPTVTGGGLVNRSLKLIMSTASFSADTDNDGYVALQVPATNDPDITPINFTYSVTTPIGQKFSIVVPYDTTPLNSVGDPLHGQPVIELIDVVPVGSSGGVGQLLRGIGIQSMVDNGAGGLLITYTDLSTTTVAMPDTVQGPPGPAGSQGPLGPAGPTGPAGVLVDGQPADQIDIDTSPIGLADLADVNVTGAAVDSLLAVGPDTASFRVRTPAQVKAALSLDASNIKLLAAEPQPALLPFHRKLAGRAAAPCDVLMIGHSFVEGVNATSWSASLRGRLVDTFRRRYPTVGVTGGDGYVPSYYAVSAFSDSPQVVAGSPVMGNGYGLGRRNVVLSTSAHKVTYTVTCDALDVFFVKYSGGGTGYYKIDGGSAVTFATTNATLADGQRIQVTGLTAGAHTVEVGWSSGGGVFHTGIAVYNGDATKGVRLWEGGRSSALSATFADRTGTNGQWLDNVTTVQPAAVILTCMINDFNSLNTQVTPATTKANLQQIIADVRAKCTIPPTFILCAEYARDTSGLTSPAPWADYQAVAAQIAAADSSVLVFDMEKRFGVGPFNSGNPNSLVHTDYLHPSNAGMQHWADSLATFMSPR